MHDFEEEVVVKPSRKFVGNGLFAKSSFVEGQMIFRCFPYNRYQPLNFINHSCSPNCRMQTYAVIAKRQIAAGEELTIDYREIRFTVGREEFTCYCGAPNCGDVIRIGVASA
jgi:SET domain-containing protein